MRRSAAGGGFDTFRFTIRGDRIWGLFDEMLKLSFCQFMWDGGGIVGGAVNAMGLVAFGALWPVVAWRCVVGLGVLALLGTGLGLHSIATTLEIMVYRPLVFTLAPLRWMLGRCPPCRLRDRGDLAETDPKVRLLRG